MAFAKGTFVQDATKMATCGLAHILVDHFCASQSMCVSFAAGFSINWIRRQHFGSIIAFGKSHWEQDAAQGNKTELVGDIALDILLFQMVFLDLPHLDQSCLDAIKLHMELDLCNSPFCTFLVNDDIFIENLASLGKPGAHGRLCIFTRFWQEYRNYFHLLLGGFSRFHQCSSIWKNIILLQ